jgi:hypothetical protein
MEREYLTRLEAADYLRLSVSQLDNLAREGKVQRAKFGEGPRARVLYRKRDLDAFFDKHVEGAESEAVEAFVAAQN